MNKTSKKLACISAAIAAEEVLANISASERAVIVASLRPNLAKLKKLTKRGILTEAEFVDAVGEALRKVRASSNLIDIMTSLLREAMNMDDPSDDDVITV